MKSERDNIANQLKRHNSNILFKDSEGESVSYGEIYQLGLSEDLIITKRKLVFCLVDNEIGGLSGYLSLLVADAVPLMLGATISLSQLTDLLVLYKPKYIWLPNSRMDEINFTECKMCFKGYCLIYIDGLHMGLNNSLSLLLGTSGSTGNPKFVRLSYNNVFSNAKSIAKYLDIKSDEIPITTLPPSYTYGLSIIHSHVLVGATIAVTKKTFFDREFWEFFRKVKATSFGGVPYHYEMLKKLKFSKNQLPSLRTLTQAGGRMEPELIIEYASLCKERGIQFFTMYGQAEATARMSYLPTEKAIIKAGSIGLAIPNGKFCLEDEKGQTIVESEVSGELIYKGTNVSMGYANGYADLLKGDERGNILRTGDIAKRDKDGYYYIVGRLSRFIKLFGNRINLLDIEKLLYKEGYVVACVGKDDSLGVYLVNSNQLQAMQIKKIVIDSIRVAPQGVSIYGISAIPRNESGKIQYSELYPEMGEFLL